jgi:hypothetical protein
MCDNTCLSKNNMAAHATLISQDGEQHQRDITAEWNRLIVAQQMNPAFLVENATVSVVITTFPFGGSAFAMWDNYFAEIKTVLRRAILQNIAVFQMYMDMLREALKCMPQLVEDEKYRILDAVRLFYDAIQASSDTATAAAPPWYGPPARVMDMLPGMTIPRNMPFSKDLRPDDLHVFISGPLRDGIFYYYC